MRKQRWSLEEMREASLDATADFAEWLHRHKSGSAQPGAVLCGDSANGELGRANQLDSRDPANYHLASMDYLGQVTRLSMAYAMLPLRLLQEFYGGAAFPEPRYPQSPQSGGLSVDALVVKPSAATPSPSQPQSQMISFLVTNRGPQQYIDIQLGRLASREGGILRDVKVTLWDADRKQHALSDGAAKRIVRLEFGRQERRQLALELSGTLGSALRRAGGELRLNPEYGGAVELPIRLEID